MYAPAFHQAASKTGERSGLSKKRVRALVSLVEASVAFMNDGDATSVTLEMTVSDDGIAAEVTGRGRSAPTARQTKRLQTLGDKRAASFQIANGKSAQHVQFEI